MDTMFFDFRQCGSDWHGAFEFSVVVFRLPWFARLFAPAAKNNGAVVHDGTIGVMPFSSAAE
jgi:hypothetical protein